MTNPFLTQLGYSDSVAWSSSDHQKLSHLPPRLLVSVRSADEAAEAIQGGADIIDVKEPANGPLGAASFDSLQKIIELVKRSKTPRPISVALGELSDLSDNMLEQIARFSSVVAVKVGLSRQKDTAWKQKLEFTKECLSRLMPATNLIAAAYADHDVAESPTAKQVLHATLELGLKGFLIDTFDKESGSLHDCIGPAELNHLVEQSREKEVISLFAGSRNLDSLVKFNGSMPTFIGVRGAVCQGGRNGLVLASKVEAFSVMLRQRLVKPV